MSKLHANAVRATTIKVVSPAAANTICGLVPAQAIPTKRDITIVKMIKIGSPYFLIN